MDRYRQIHFGFRIPMITLPIGCLFQLISVGSPYWVKIKVSSLIQSVDIHLGLWRACFALNNAKPECSSDMSDNPDWFRATQACAILGLIFAVVAMVSLYLKNCSSFQNKALGLLAMVSAFAAAIMIVIGVSVFAVRMTDLLLPTGKTRLEIGTDYLNWGWYIGIAAGVTFIKAAIFVSIGVMNTRND
ncbi:Hypothetical predicted protein [Mytilus galloprovincialis]|uniref:Uncharacterized protein n=1 Tax=Mytilus galloprovincialis TaxID=29158 RepID=A0A8B6DH55_MYTGA|nr:Hypothetical predicted protein [Mytilus galloprovincialis]